MSVPNPITTFEQYQVEITKRVPKHPKVISSISNLKKKVKEGRLKLQENLSFAEMAALIFLLRNNRIHHLDIVGFHLIPKTYWGKAELLEKAQLFLNDIIQTFVKGSAIRSFSINTEYMKNILEASDSAIATLLGDTGISELSLSGYHSNFDSNRVNNIFSNLATIRRPIVSELKTSKLTTLKLGASLKEGGLSAFADIIAHNNTITSLTVCAYLSLREECSLQDIKAYGEMLRINTTLQSLRIKWCIDKNGEYLNHLFAALETNKTLTSLLIEKPRVNSKTESIVKEAFLKNGTLTTLEIRDFITDNAWGDDSLLLGKILPCLTSKSLTTLIFKNSFLDVSELQSLSSNLMTNRTLTSLDLRDCGTQWQHWTGWMRNNSRRRLEENELQPLLAALQENTSLCKLLLSKAVDFHYNKSAVMDSIEQFLERNRIIFFNKGRDQWAPLAVVLAFIRANYGNSFKDSIVPLVPAIVILAFKNWKDYMFTAAPTKKAEPGKSSQTTVFKFLETKFATASVHPIEKPIAISKPNHNAFMPAVATTAAKGLSTNGDARTPLTTTSALPLRNGHNGGDLGFKNNIHLTAPVTFSSRLRSSSKNWHRIDEIAQRRRPPHNTNPITRAVTATAATTAAAAAPGPAPTRTQRVAHRQ